MLKNTIKASVIVSLSSYALGSEQTVDIRMDGEAPIDGVVKDRLKESVPLEGDAEEVEDKRSIKHPKRPFYNQRESNSLIRGSDLGKIDLEFFEKYMVKPDQESVHFDQSWFVGVFDSACQTTECLNGWENFKQLFLIWIGETLHMDREMGDYDPDNEAWANSQENLSLNTFKIAQVDCDRYQSTICNRILPDPDHPDHDKELPRFLILNGDSAWEWPWPMSFWEL